MRESNIGPRQQRSRLLIAIAMALVTASGMTLLLSSDAARTWRLALFVPLWIGGLGLFQALDKT